MELQHDWGTHRIGDIEIGHDGRKVEIKLDDPDVIVETMPFKAGDSLFAPKSTDIFEIKGTCRLILTRV